MEHAERSCALVLALCACGCAQSTIAIPFDTDGGASAAPAADLLDGRDVDLSSTDTTDLSAVTPDLGACPDLDGHTVPDLKGSIDLRASADLHAPTDLHAPADLRSLPDLSRPRDLRTPLDLSSRPPGPPMLLSALFVSRGNYDLSWSLPASRCDSLGLALRVDGGSYTQRLELPGTISQWRYSDRDLMPNQEVCFRLTCTLREQRSSPSNERCAGKP